MGEEDPPAKPEDIDARGPAVPRSDSGARSAKLTGLRPGLLLAAVESARSAPIRRAVFTHAKLVHVMEGRVRLETASGSCELLPGSAFVLGAGQWCSMRPLPFARVWTLYLDEDFLRAQMRWVLRDSSPLRPGVHPDSWDGSAITVRPGMTILRRQEPLWRQISVMDQAETTAVMTTRLIGLFTRTIEFGLPSLMIGQDGNEGHEVREVEFPVRGTLTRTPHSQQVHRAVDLLRRRMAEPWSVLRLSVQVATSRSHLTRLFNDQVGVAPMRFLTEIRLTEFTRLIEETELSVSSAARAVGWVDARIAAAWFRRRLGVTPSEYRRHPHPTIADGSLDERWRDPKGLSDSGWRANARFDP